MTTANHQADAVLPQRIEDLSDTTRCPACFTPLRSANCHYCGLDLTHADAAPLAELSAEAARLLQRRVELIAGIRSTAPTPVPAPIPAPVPTPASVPEPTPVPAPVPAPAAAAAPATLGEPAPPAPVHTAPSGAPAAPRRSGVQVALLITGISLLSVFAIFFMVYAFINYGLVWRSIIIGTVTVAAFVGASLLRRRSLGASSEAIAVFALVLVYLDAFAVRANDLFGLAAVEGDTYWGTVFIASSIAFIAWYRLARVRAASLVGYTMLPVGVAVLANVLTAGLPSAASVYTVALAVALTGVVQHTAQLVAARPDAAAPALPERGIVASLTAPALLVAAGAAITLSPEQPMGLSLGLLGCAVVAALLALSHAVAAQHRQNRVLGTVLAASAGFFLGGAAAGYGVRTAGENDLAMLVIAAPVLLIVLLLVAPIRIAAGAARAPVVSAALGASAVAAVAVLSAALVAMAGVALQLAGAVASPRTDPTVAKTLSAGHFDAHLVLACSVIAIAVAAGLLRSLPRLRGLLAVVGVAVLLTAPPLLPSDWTIIAAWTLLGALGLTVRITRPRWLPVAMSIAAIGGIALAWTAGWAADATWPVTSAVAVAATIAGRRVARSPWSRATLSGLATLLLVVAAAATAEQLTDDLAAAWPGALAAAAALLAVAAVRRLPISAPERRTVFWSGLAAAGIAAVSITAGWGSDMVLAPLTIAGGLVLTAALVAWAMREKGARGETHAAAILLAPSAAFTLAAIATVAPVDEVARQYAPAAAALVVAAGALLATVRSHHTAPRWSFDLGVAAATVPTLLALTGTLEPGWIALLLVAVTVTVSATSADGLVGSQSPRRHAGWLGLALATIALWWGVFDAGVEHPEPYVLPPALALVAIAGLIRRRELRAGTGATDASAWVVLLLGLLLAIVPLATSDHGTAAVATARAITVLAVSAALMLTASALAARFATRGEHALRPVLAVGSAGLLGTVLVTVLRSIDADARAGATLESWLAPGVAAIVLASLVVARAHRRAPAAAAAGQRTALLQAVSAGLFRLAVVIVAVFETAAVAGAPGNDATVLRATVTVAVLALLHVASVAWPVVPLGGVTAWISLGLAVIAAVSATGSLDHIEQATVPIALALVASGGIHLHREARARSWPHLGPGVAVLLLPSLFATFGDAPAWRLVALGVVGIVMIIAGVTLRLQAPFLIGTVVVIVHALHTFAPQLRAVYEAADWYIWAGVGGVVVTAIAIRYEQRLRDLKRVASSIASLR